MGYCRACVPGQCSARNEVQGLAKWLLTVLDFDVNTHISGLMCALVKVEQGALMAKPAMCIV